MEMLHCLMSLRTLVLIVKDYTQSFINQDGKHSAGFQCNQMHQVGLTVHDINTHSFYESLRERKIKHITIRLMSNSINYGEKEREVTYLACLKTVNT